MLDLNSPVWWNPLATKRVTWTRSVSERTNVPGTVANGAGAP
jgi:hypothetical protein